MSDGSLTAHLYHVKKWSRDPDERVRARRLLRAIKDDNLKANRKRQRRLGIKRPFLYKNSFFGQDYRWNVRGINEDRDQIYYDLWRRSRERAAARIDAMQKRGAMKARPIPVRVHLDGTDWTNAANDPRLPKAYVVTPGKKGALIKSAWIKPFSSGACNRKTLFDALNAAGLPGSITQQDGESSPLLSFGKGVSRYSVDKVLRRCGWFINRVNSFF